MDEELTNQIELRRLELEAEREIKQLENEARALESEAGIKKVIFGTMIVGIVAALFPFLSALAELSTTKQIERIKASAQLQIATEKNKLDKELARTQAELQRKSDTHTRLESFANEGRAADIDKRIVLAQYYSHLTIDEEDRTRWVTFLKFLEDLKSEERQAKLSLQRASSLEERTEARDKLRSIQSITRTTSSFEDKGELRPSEFVLELQHLTFTERCADEVFANRDNSKMSSWYKDGIFGPFTERCVIAALGEIDFLPELHDRQALFFTHEGRSALISALRGEMPVERLKDLKWEESSRVFRDDPLVTQCLRFACQESRLLVLPSAYDPAEAASQSLLQNDQR